MEPCNIRSALTVKPCFSSSPIPPPGGTELLFTQFGVALPEPRSDHHPISLERRGVTSQTPPTDKSRRLDAQLEFWERLTLYTEAIVAKLDTAGRSDIADQIRDCHSEVSYRRCRGCSTVSKFYNRCEHKWCPLCAPRLSRERKKMLEVWSGEVAQPKHVVLTVRNSEAISRLQVKRYKTAFAKLRRTKFASNWRGGFYSIETTNESRGWHIHFHCLVDADWIDQGQLAIEWAKQIGQDFAIVYVKDARGEAYLAEVCKYLVKGSVLAKWSGEEIAAFVDAFDSVRCFGVFGSLLGQRSKVREQIEAFLDVKPACECGCTDFQVMSPNELEEFQLHRRITFRIIPPKLTYSNLNEFAQDQPRGSTWREYL